MENATRSTRINDRFESFRSGSVFRRQCNIHGERGIVAEAAFAVGSFPVRWFEAHTDKGAHSLGVLIMTGSETPAFSLLATASLYVEPTATILLSSSDRATHLSSGADCRASKRESELVCIILPTYLIRRISVSKGFPIVNRTLGKYPTSTRLEFLGRCYNKRFITKPGDRFD